MIVLGCFLLSLPLILLFLAIVSRDGIGVALSVFGAFALIMGCIVGGLYCLHLAGVLS